MAKTRLGWAKGEEIVYNVLLQPAVYICVGPLQSFPTYMHPNHLPR